MLFSLFAGAGHGHYPTIPYSQFQQLLDQGKVKSVVVSGQTIPGGPDRSLPNSKTAEFVTYAVPSTLASQLAQHHVEFTGGASGSGWGTLLSWVIPPLIFVGIWLFAMRGMAGRMGGGLGGGLMSIGREGEAGGGNWRRDPNSVISPGWTKPRSSCTSSLIT